MTSRPKREDKHVFSHSFIPETDVMGHVPRNTVGPCSRELTRAQFPRKQVNIMSWTTKADRAQVTTVSHLFS